MFYSIGGQHHEREQRSVKYLFTLVSYLRNYVNYAIAGAFERKEIHSLKIHLSEKTLESLEEEDVNTILHLLEKNNRTFDEVMLKLNRRPEARVMSIVL